MNGDTLDLLLATPTTIYDESGVEAGSITLNPDGSYTFDPAPNTTEQGETVTTPLLANDSDPDEDALTVTTASGLDMSGNPITLTTTPQDIYDENGVLAGQATMMMQVLG